MTTEIERVTPGDYTCFLCDYSTSRKSSYDTHVTTKKHIQNKQKNSNIQCNFCNVFFNNRMSLCRHRRSCEKNNGEESKLVQYLLQENKEFKQMVIELCKTVQTTVSTTNNNNNSHNTNNILNNNCHNTTNNNNSFNLQFFLNETCKDALNMSDFIKSIQVGLEDLDRIGNIGYVDGISGIIIKSLQELGVEKRPIHCTDAKRQTLYVKEDDQWTKEDPEWSHLQHMVNEVQKFNLRQLPAWRDQHPNCLTSTSKYTSFYNHMSQELMGGDCKKVKMQIKDNKIMNKIMKEVVIDKSFFLGEK
jgi:hypothetical protein